MARTFFKSIQNSVKYWWVPLLVGFIFIGLGVFNLMNPVLSFSSLTLLFSVLFLLSGISEMIFAFANKDEMDNWGWTLTFGLVTSIVGFILIANPMTSMTILAYYIGFLILFRSISGISYAIDLKNFSVHQWKYLMIISLLGTIFGIILLWNPILAGLTVVFWLGMGMITIGLFAVFLGINLRKLKSRAK